MIWRGLQIVVVVGIIALGAAPCLGQVTLAHPELIYLEEVYAGGLNFSGIYRQVGEIQDTSVTSLRIWQRYTTDGSTPRYLSVEIRSMAPGNTRIRIICSLTYPSTPSTPLSTDLDSNDEIAITIGTIESMNQTAGFENVLWFSDNNGAAVVIFYELTEFREAFPDWQSAGVKIPLGFAMGMAFWAAAVALTIPMKWVKELVSAAS